MARPRSSVTELAALFNSAKQPVYVLDERLTIVFCNRPACSGRGSSESELVGRRCAWHSSPDVAPGRCHCGRALPAAGGALAAGDYRFTSPWRAQERAGAFVPLGGAAIVGGILAIVDAAACAAG